MRTATPVNFTLDLNGRSGPRSGLLCGYSRLPETMAEGAAALIGQVTAGLMAAG